MNATRLLTLVAALSLATVPMAAQSEIPASSPSYSAGAAPPAAADAPAPEDHPAPAHTGWASLAKDTFEDFKAFPRRRSTWVLLGAGLAGAAATHPADRYVETHVVGNDTATTVFGAGKYLGGTYAQVGAGLGLWVVGRYVIPADDETRTNKWSHLGFDLMRGQIVSQTLVQAMKHSVRRDRPSGECCAFPSGHAATAFATAAILERHLGYRGSWPALVGAAYVAASRLVDHRHFLSDVVMGAAIGEAAGWTVVGRHGRSSWTWQPVPVPDGMMIAVARTPD